MSAQHLLIPILLGLVLLAPAEADARWRGYGWHASGPPLPWWCAPSRTGTGGGPWTTITAPHTSRVGRTKPPRRGAGPEPFFVRRALWRIERENDRIGRRVCVGCDG